MIIRDEFGRKYRMEQEGVEYRHKLLKQSKTRRIYGTTYTTMNKDTYIDFEVWSKDRGDLIVRGISCNGWCDHEYTLRLRKATLKEYLEFME